MENNFAPKDIQGMDDLVIKRQLEEARRNLSKEMENKYFTPFPEDIRIGYECEVLEEFRKRNDSNKYGYEEIWSPRTVKSYTLQDTLDELSRGSVRVSYLTENQIRNEGWSRTYDFKRKVMDETWAFDKPFEHNLDKLRVVVVYIPSLLNLEVYWEPISRKFTNNNFSGKCKDINNFRTICKFLGI